jgi:AraC-like DNA-binding protein
MPSFSYERHHFSFALPPVQSSFVFLDEYLQTGERYTEFLSRIGGCIGNASETTHTARMLLNVEFERILIMLGGICESAYSKQRLSPTLDKILLFIRARLAGAISVHDICTHFNLSRSYLARLFKQYLQMTPTAYINNEKMHYAGELLQNTDMNISEIAEYLGYCDVFYFSRLYKRTFGVPPSRDFKR